MARYLHELGVPVLGIDLSPAMVEAARRLHPELTFAQGTMLALDAADAAWGGIVAFYSVIHVPPDTVPAALSEFHRVLRPNGLLLLAFHVGRERIHLDEWWGHPVSLDFHFFEPAAIEDHLQATGFIVEARVERQPYVGVEHPSRRAYLLARKPEV